MGLRNLGLGLFNKVQRNQVATNVAGTALGAGIGLGSGAQDDNSPVFWGGMGTLVGGIAGSFAGPALYKGLLGMKKKGMLAPDEAFRSFSGGRAGTGSTPNAERVFTRERRGR